MATSTIKSEPTGDHDMHIKPEHGDVKQELYEDDDQFYEDAGDLDTSKGDKPVWLVKLPAFVSEKWREIDDDEEIVLGTVKIPPNYNEDPSVRLKLILEKNETNGLDTPSEYDLQITNLEVTNTYVFTEKDMPGYENRAGNMGAKEGEPAIPQRLYYQQREREREANRDPNVKRDWKNQRHTPYHKKAIPKRTALVGTARHEITMIPAYNEEYRKYQGRRQLLEDGPKFFTKRITDTQAAPNLLNPGTTGLLSKPFNNFVKPTQAIRKSTDPKAYRMSQNDLTSALFKCFQEHEYWSMKAFRERLVQPEAFLKQVLDEIGIMNRSGPYSGKWSLKPDYKNFLGNPDAVPGDGPSQEVISIDDDDEDEVEMHDVPM